VTSDNSGERSSCRSPSTNKGKMKGKRRKGPRAVLVELSQGGDVSWTLKGSTQKDEFGKGKATRGEGGDEGGREKKRKGTDFCRLQFGGRR